MCKLVEIGWGRENPVFREVFTRLFIPDCTPSQYDWFTELQHTTTSPENAMRLIAARIKGARFIPLESRSHILLEQDPAWQQFLDELQKFVNQHAALPHQPAQDKPSQARVIKHLKVAAIQ